MKITKEQANKSLVALNNFLWGNDQWYETCDDLDMIKYSSQLEEERIAVDRKYNPDKHGEPCDDYPVLADIFEALGIKVDVELKAPKGYYKGWHEYVPPDQK